MKLASLKCLPLLAVLLSLQACSSEEASQAEKVKYETKVVQPEQRTYNNFFPATISGQNDIQILAQVSGTLKRICADNGTMVKKGQTLFVIDQTPFQLSLQTAKANLNVAKAQMESARLQYESNQPLAAKKIISDYVLSTSLNTYQAAKASVEQCQAQVDLAQTNLNYCTITSPYDGLFTLGDYREGSLIAAGVQQLGQVSDNRQMEVNFFINEATLLAVMREYNLKTSAEGLVTADNKQARNLMPGLALQLKDGTEYSEKGVMKYMSGNIDKTTGTAKCAVTFDNPQGVLRSGLTATIVLPQSAEVLCVPQTAAVRLQDKYMFYRVNTEGKAEGIMCQVISSNDGKEYYILDGLKAGDEVVINGARKLKNGDQVK